MEEGMKHSVYDFFGFLIALGVYVGLFCGLFLLADSLY